MSKLKSTAYALLAVSFLGITGLAEATLSHSAVAQTQTASARTGKFGGFFAPKGQTMPKNSEGGASRGRCLQNRTGLEETVTLLTPEGNSGLTATARPTFMAYVDQTSAKQVFFSLKNDDESYFFEMTMSLPNDEPGLVEFHLPDNAPALEVGEQYRWSVAVICGSKLGPDSPWASGWVERVEDDAPANVTALTPIEQASRYGRAGLWYETVEVLASLKNDNHREGKAAWSQLLNEGGLTNLPQ